MAFTPWTTLDGYCELLQAIDALDLVEHVSPVQLVIRLLIPEGSRLLELDEVRAIVEPYSAGSLTYPWRHAIPRVDALQRRLEALVGRRLMPIGRSCSRGSGRRRTPLPGARSVLRRETPASLPRAAIPYLNEPWYC